MATATAVAAVGAMTAWMAASAPDAGVPVAAAGSGPVQEQRADFQSRDGGSQVPCQAPLAWRVARVDEEFGLDVSEARALIQQAAGMWARAVGRPLFRNDRERGFPIRLMYDERQSRAQERLRREADLDRAYERLEATREGFLERAGRHEGAAARYNERVRDLERRVAGHNEAVRLWNERGGAPEDVAVELEEAGHALDAGRRALEVEARELEREQRSLLAAEAAIAEQEREHMLESEAVSREFPSASEQAGAYREAVEVEGGRVTSVSREIRIFRFSDEGDLRLIAAHELGHALGLGHGGDAAAVMNEEHVEGGAAAGVARVHPSDLEQLSATCPDLIPGSP